MSRQTFIKWQIAGFQAYKSAIDQAVKRAQQAQKEITNADLNLLAHKSVETMNRHAAILTRFLVDAGAEDKAHDEIMDGINRGTDLAVQAAEDSGTRDVALLFGAKVTLNYFFVAFSNHAATAEALELSDQAITFQQMAQQHQGLFEEYTRLGAAKIFPDANIISV